MPRRAKRWAAAGLTLIFASTCGPATSWAGPKEDLAAAILDRNVAAARQALAEGASANTAMNDGMTPLGDAAFWGPSAMVDLLLSHGADVNALGGPKEMQMTPLSMAAATSADTDAVTVAELLIGRGANIEATDSNGVTPIGEAAGFGRLKMVALLAGAGANINYRRPKDGETPLHLAISVVDFLL